jgi:hypothetical protein
MHVHEEQWQHCLSAFCNNMAWMQPWLFEAGMHATAIERLVA